MEKSTKPNNLVQTIERTSRLLDKLADNPQGISIRDLSDVVELPKGTTHRLLSSLAYFGYVRQDPKTRDYFLGLRLLELGQILLGQLDLRKYAEPFLRELAKKTGETVHLVILDRDEIVYIDKMEGDQNPSGLKMASRIGSRNPVHSTAVGKALLASFTDEEFNRFIKKKNLPKRTGNTFTDHLRLKEHLREVRLQGFSVDDEENEVGIRCVAAVICDQTGRAVAAMSISGPAFRITRERIHDSLCHDVMETTAAISVLLGYRKRQQ